jgi:Dolichyl-phosphate-mannose-protein mannosyltransferase
MRQFIVSILRPLEASPRKTLLVLAVAIFCAHLGWSLWFVTASPTDMPKTSLRLQGDAFLQSYPSWDTDEERDGAFHNRGAMGVLRTGVPRTRNGSFSDHSPLYAYFVATCYKLGGVRLLSLAIPQAAISALLGVMLALTASRLYPGQLKASAAAGTALLILPHFNLAGSVAYPIPAVVLMFFFTVALFAVSLSGGERLGLFACAMVAGIFTHASFFIVGGAAGLWLLIQFARRKNRTYLVWALVLLAFAVLKLGLSVVDKSSSPKEHMRMATQGLLWQGNNPYYEDLSVWGLWEERCGNPSAWSQWTRTGAQDQRAHDYLQRAGGDWQAAGLLWIKENPGQYAKLCLMRFRTELSPYAANASPARKILSVVYWLLVFPAGAYGVWRGRGTAFGLLASLVVVAVIVFDSLVFVTVRYRLPVEMIFTVFAGLTYAGWLEAWTDLGHGGPGRPAGAIPSGPKPVQG